MKKFATIFVLLFVLSVSAFADEGEIPAGGKNCPQGQTCLTGQIPVGGRANESSDSAENPVYLDIFNFIKSIFG